MKNIGFIFIIGMLINIANAQSLLTTKANTFSYSIEGATIFVDENDDAVVKKAATLLQQDLLTVTGKSSLLEKKITDLSGTLIVIGSIGKSSTLQKWVKEKKLLIDGLAGKWEGYSIQTIKNPVPGVTNALVIVGSDRRGAAFGIFELSKQIGVSPWYWWADVPVKKQADIYVDAKVKLSDAPKVKYRGIFINDEAPALSNWSREKFGGFNHQFYEKVFELMLRLKSNYLWPAMWGNAFYYDDSLNIKSADEFGIVIGTSHHEPLMRAHEEWKYFGKGRKWNYDSTEAGLKEFWKGGMERAWNEKIVSVGMRGDGDEPMSRETATALLERIVTDQRKIIADVTGKPAEKTPQLWALYKEVQDYYDKGMRVPDDVTLLLCDDNWGNLRKLPKLNEKPRKGGYGIYYHFDYVGGPRNYKWLNTNPLPRIWEQLHLAYEHNVKDIWIVNVGDIKPMELPISFFLDYAWDPSKINADNILNYTEKWAAQQFDKTHAKQIAQMLAENAKYTGRRKPELLDDKTYSLHNYNEFENVVSKYNKLLADAESMNESLPKQYRDAFFQLVLHPIKANANLHEMYYYTALNKEAYTNRQTSANKYADKVKNLYINDSLITLQYHQLNKGKWNHMMSQTHIGYTYWQQPNRQKMPEVKYVSQDAALPEILAVDSVTSYPKTLLPKQFSGRIFYEKNQVVSIEAAHFSHAIHSNAVQWKVLPDHGKTGDAVTGYPVTAVIQNPGGRSPHLQYEVYMASTGNVALLVYFSPTLNFENTASGLQYAVSIDDEPLQIISLNGDDKNSISGIWNKWVAENIIIRSTTHHIATPGKHVVKFWMVDGGVVLQKLVLDAGGLQSTYLGPPETILEK